MASKSTWKGAERRLARFFGTVRTPLSGGSSGHTRSDTLHRDFFFEAKQRVKHAVWTLWQQTKPLADKEDKIPVVVLFQKNQKGFLIVVHSDDFDEFAARAVATRQRLKESSGEVEELSELPTSSD